ncbi:MAG: hypothetical protein AAFV29_25490, partial [Myxococcota bacterium]
EDSASKDLPTESAGDSPVETSTWADNVANAIDSSPASSPKDTADESHQPGASASDDDAHKSSLAAADGAAEPATAPVSLTNGANPEHTQKP